MGSSAKKRKDKKKDFQKPKLKVGKARAKPANFTDTSFRSKSIVLNQQSITTRAPTPAAQFSHHLSLLSSKTDQQRKESLSFLTGVIKEKPLSLPQPASVIFPKVLPLILDRSDGVRAQLLKLLHELPANQVEDQVDQIHLYVRGGLTHIAIQIRISTADMLIWALGCCGDAMVSCAGGWVKTLRSLMLMQGWSLDPDKASLGWTKTQLGQTDFQKKVMAQGRLALADFLKAGLYNLASTSVLSPTTWRFPLTHTAQHMIPKKSNPFGHLNLFGPPRDEDSGMYEDREDRQRIFHKLFEDPMTDGLREAKSEGGAMGRSAAEIGAIIKEGMKDFVE
ncbi:MAG: hypothetical protein Q9183_003442 [Haloplaca sp. 2 TL-2023]